MGRGRPRADAVPKMLTHCAEPAGGAVGPPPVAVSTLPGARASHRSIVHRIAAAFILIAVGGCTSAGPSSSARAPVPSAGGIESLSTIGEGSACARDSGATIVNPFALQTSAAGPRAYRHRRTGLFIDDWRLESERRSLRQAIDDDNRRLRNADRGVAGVRPTPADRIAERSPRGDPFDRRRAAERQMREDREAVVTKTLDRRAHERTIRQPRPFGFTPFPPNRYGRSR